jgi:putative ABC transport system permease protein
VSTPSLRLERRGFKFASRAILRLQTIATQALREVSRAHQRTLLTSLALILGVAGAIIAESYASAGHAQLVEQLQRLGITVVTVTPKQSRNAGVRARTGAPVTTLDARDYREIQRRVPELDGTSATVVGSFLAKAGDLSKSNSTVLGVEPSFALIRQWRMHSGESFSEADERSAARVAVLGASVARDLFNDSLPIGQRMFINRVPFRVVGVLEDSGSDLGSASQDDQIFVPLRTASRRLLNVDSYSSLVLNVSQWSRMGDAVDNVRSVLTATHRDASPAREDFQIQTQQALAEAAVDAAKRVRRYVSLITAGSLLTAGFGTLAICWISVGQRTAEIGTRRALGATARDIFLLFLIEVMLIGLTAAVFGVALGQVLTIMLSAWLKSPLTFHWYTGVVIATLETLLALGFGAGPAMRASRIDPILALRTR